MKEETGASSSCGIIGFGCYLPRYRIRTEDIASFQGHDAKMIKQSLMLLEKTVPGIDEDTATISVEAAKQAVARARKCDSNFSEEKVGCVYVGSESHPYAVKPTATIVAETLAMGNTFTAADFEFACKAGTAAVQAGLAMVRAGMAQYALVGGADTAQATPGDPLEYTASAGGGMLVLGRDPAVRIVHTCSYTSDTPDFWRRAHQAYPSHGGTFTGEPAYFRHVVQASRMLLEQTGTGPEDYAYVILHQPNGKFCIRAAKMLGFSEDKYKDGLLVDRIGNTYSGAVFIALCRVLEKAKPGDKILLTSYGSGAGSDSLALEVTDKISSMRHLGKSVREYLDDKEYVSYAEMARMKQDLHG